MSKFKTVKGSKSKWFIGLVVFVILAIIIVVPGSRAKYQVSGSVDIVDGEVSYSFADLNVLAVYLEDDNGNYVSSDTVPTSGYTLSSDTYCEVDGVTDSNITVSYDNGAVSVINITQKGTKCYLYFDIKDTVSIVSVTLTDTWGKLEVSSIEFDGTCDSPTYYFSSDGYYYDECLCAGGKGTTINYYLYALCTDDTQTEVYSGTYTGTSNESCGCNMAT